jgi:protein involved in polysaccharide export with SLBB domain
MMLVLGLTPPLAGQQKPLTPPLAGQQKPLTEVTIEGQVLRPGTFPFQAGMRVNSLLLQAGGLRFRSDAETVAGEVLRITETGALEVLFFDPAAALRRQSADNPQLQVGDRVVIYAVRGEELSAIEQLIAGRIPKRDVQLRQFGYDLFAPAPIPQEPGAAAPSGRKRGAALSRRQRGGGTPGGQKAATLFGDQRFDVPTVDLRFAPLTTDVPVGPDYIIGPGDSLNIVLWGGVEDFYQIEVNRNGAIVLPRLGVVQVWGMTIEQLEKSLRQRFGQYYPDFQMAVTLGRLRTIRVYVVGEVQQPGAYTVSSLSTIVNALFASGGPTKNGSLRHMRLLRQGKVIHTLDLYDFLLQGDKSQDQILQSGDTIFVPVIGPVAGVAGNVRRPAIYEIKPGITLQHLLELAGGVTPLGYLQRVHVERFVANKRKVVVDFDLSGSPGDRASLWQTRLEDGDLVHISPSSPR